MALLELHGLDGPLRQGDLLRDLTLYTSSPEGAPSPSISKMGVVTSRNCNAVRAETVIIVAILPYRADRIARITEGSPSLDELRRRFDAIRDGDGQPDRFYLGNLPAHDDKVRFVARLDLIHTVEVPTETNAREAWIASRRFARLSGAHRRHLHARLFTAVAGEGFDDVRWWAEPDLELMVLAGERAIRAAQEKLAGIKENLHTLDSQGLQPNQLANRKQGLEKGLQTALREVSEHESALAPYAAELRRRRETNDPGT